MALPIIQDHVVEGLELLISQWADKPVVQGLLKSYLENLQPVEDTFFQLLEERSVYTAIGAQLDVVGLLVGELRRGRNDEEYRQAILNRSSVNNSNGTPEEILNALSAITLTPQPRIWEHYPANIHAYVDRNVANTTGGTLRDISLAGVSTRLMFDRRGNSFRGADTTGEIFDLALENLDLLEITDFLEFITTWDTSEAGVSASNQIAIPTVATGTYNATVDWGDGNVETGFTSYNDTRWTHTYSSPGTYTVSITGQFEGWMFNNGGDKDKILSVSRWGDDFRLGNSGLYFFGCSNLSTINATDAPNLSGTTSLGGAFYNCSSLVSITSGNLWDTSGITRANACFRNCTSFIGGCAQWDVSNITIINDIFRGASIYNEDISGWITSNFISTANMFSGATLFDQPIGSWDMSNVTNASAMFVSGAFNQDISGWNTGKMANMNSMFLNMTLFDQDLGGWDVSSLTQAINMLLNSTLSTANYDSLLVGWNAQALQSGVTFSGGNSKYSAGAAATARANIISTYSWVITDGGPA